VFALFAGFLVLFSMSVIVTWFEFQFKKLIERF
jgi:hypothetical protein